MALGEIVSKQLILKVQPFHRDFQFKYTFHVYQTLYFLKRTWRALDLYKFSFIFLFCIATDLF